MKNIKRIMVVMVILAMTFSLVACGSSNSGKGASEEEESLADSIDVDLTNLSATMVYSEVYNMFAAPDDYIGKTVKMEGLFATYHDDSTNMDYYACIIEDATACCAQGLEFDLVKGEYPEEGDTVTVVGVFDTYKEGEAMYCILRDAEILPNEA